MARKLKTNLLSANGNCVRIGKVRTQTDDLSARRSRVSGNLLVEIWREDWFQVSVGVALATTHFNSPTQ